MYSEIMSSAIRGVDGTIISVEADVNDGLPTFTMVGYLSSSVKEAGERVKTALKNSGYHLPPKRITINLSPADIRKDGSGFDLPIALAVLASMGLTFDIDLSRTLIVGELGLDGEVRAIPGVLAMVHYASLNGFDSCIVPYDNSAEAAMVNNIKVYGVKSLADAILFLQGAITIEPYVNHYAGKNGLEYLKEDFSDIKGQDTLKRGMEIAAAGFHNVLMSGAAGAGKSMLARRLPSILPELTHEESIEVTKIYSISGLLRDNASLISKRPFRSPHHTISGRALVGGGSVPKPGEISLAHHGVLFLDELPEFSKNVLEVLRQPLEDKSVTIARVNSTYCFPADFMLVAAMNLCPCGYFPDMKRCTCSPTQIIKYREKISGPLMDRIDINMNVKPVEYDDIFSDRTGESSYQIRCRVKDAIAIQKKRYKDEGILFNSQLSGSLIRKHLILNEEQQEVLSCVFRTKKLSVRGTYRILKLARTIADLDRKDNIETAHLKEAIFFRNNESYENKEVI